MKRSGRFFACGFAVAFLLALTSARAIARESKPVTISGKVVLVKAASGQVLVAYRRPSAVIDTISTLRVDDKTTLKNIGNIAELRINDTVSVSYVESDGSILAAQVLEKPAASADLRETPAGPAQT